MKTVNIMEARAHLCRLIAQSEKGEEIVICRAGKPVARLVRPGPPTGTQTARRKAGILRGKLRIGPDFDAPLPKDIASALGVEPPAQSKTRNSH